MVPRTTCGCEVAASFWSSSHSVGFFCLVRRAYRLRADSTLKAAEVWKECDVDDNADANVGAAILEAAETKVQYVK
jgi:hypothetical protein